MHTILNHRLAVFTLAVSLALAVVVVVAAVLPSTASAKPKKKKPVQPVQTFTYEAGEYCDFPVQETVRVKGKIHELSSGALLQTAQGVQTYTNLDKTRKPADGPRGRLGTHRAVAQRRVSRQHEGPRHPLPARRDCTKTVLAVVAVMAAMLVALAAPALADNDRNDNDRNYHRWFDNNRDHDDWNYHEDNLIFVYDDDDFDYDDFDDDDYPYYWGWRYYPYYLGWSDGCEGPVCLID